MPLKSTLERAETNYTAMNYLLLLGKHLKDEAVIEILELEDIKVWYEFDRLHENTPDVYWTESKEKGVQFRFDSNQMLDVIFLYAANLDGFSPVSRENCDIPFFSTIKEAETYGNKGLARLKRGKPTEFLGILREWVKLDFGNYSLHYEFRPQGLALITVKTAET